jgi:ATP-dependent Clp endopeptidase proteolytic subunit ClpP
MYELRAKSNTETDVLMYGSISEWGRVRAEDFISKLTDARAKGYQRVNLKINSPGGSIVEGIAIMSQMGREDLFIIGTVEGMAASMASVMLQGCHKRRMVKGGRLMIHQGQGGVYGTANYIRDYADLLESYNKTLADIYAKRSKKHDAKWIMENWMAEGKDMWFTAEQALKEGLIDEIIDGNVKPLEKEEATLHEMAAHYQQFFDTTKTGMTREEQIAFLGLKAEATDAEIKAAFDALKKPAQPAAPAAAAPATTTITAEKQKLIDEVVLLAKERGADDKLQESIKKIAAIDMTVAMEMIPKQPATAATTETPKTPVSVNEALAALKVSGGGAAPTDSSKWDWKEWSKHPKEFHALLEKNPKEYIKIFNAEFGYEPSEAELKGVTK